MTPATILSVLLGCSGESSPVDTAPHDADTDVTEPDVTEPDVTEPDPLVASEVTVTMSSTIGAVAQVSFTAEGEGSGVVVFGEEGGEASYQVAATAQDDGSWRAVLVGVPADATGWLQVGRNAAKGQSGSQASHSCLNRDS